MCLCRKCDPFRLENEATFVVGWKIMQRDPRDPNKLHSLIYNILKSYTISNWHPAELDQQKFWAYEDGWYTAGFHFCQNRHEAVLYSKVMDIIESAVLVKCLFTPPWHYGLDESGVWTAVSSHMKPVKVFKLPKPRPNSTVFNLRSSELRFLRLNELQDRFVYHPSGRVRIKG